MVTVVTNLLQQEKLFFILQLFSSPQLPCSSAFRLKVSPERNKGRITHPYHTSISPTSPIYISHTVKHVNFPPQKFLME